MEQYPHQDFLNRNPHTGIPINVKHLHGQSGILATGHHHEEGAKPHQVSSLSRNALRVNLSGSRQRSATAPESTVPPDLSYTDGQHVLSLDHQYGCRYPHQTKTEKKKNLSNWLVFDISSCYLSIHTTSVKLWVLTKFFFTASFSMCSSQEVSLWRTHLLKETRELLFPGFIFPGFCWEPWDTPSECSEAAQTPDCSSSLWELLPAMTLLCPVSKLPFSLSGTLLSHSKPPMPCKNGNTV